MANKKEHFPKGFSLISGTGSGSYSSIEDKNGNLLEIGKDLSDKETEELLEQIKNRNRKKFWRKVLNKISFGK